MRRLLLIGCALLCALLVHTVASAHPGPPPVGTPRAPGEDPQTDQGKPGTGVCQTASAAATALGVVPLSVTATGNCSGGGFTVYQQGSRTYAIITGRYEAGFVLMDVTDPAHPVLVTTWMWRTPAGSTIATAYTYTQDAKHFKQGSRHFVSLNQEAFGNSQGYCGVAIVEVTNPASPVFVQRVRGADWCDVHNTFVEPDANGDGAYLYLTADEPDDLRVLDIRDLTNITEIGKYREPGASYIHDITVINRRVYISYWEYGLVILDAAAVTPGIQPAPLNPTGSIRPTGFRVHHALPTPDGNYVFIQDEIGSRATFKAVRMWDIRDLQNPREVASLGIPYRQAHNLLVTNDRLYVAWYEAGLQGWNIDTLGKNGPTLTKVAQHTLRSSFAGGYHGAWGVERLPCQVAGLARTCLYTGDMEIGLDIVVEADPRFTPTDLNQDGAVDVVDIQLVARHWGARTGDSRYYGIFDLDQDGEVSSADVQRTAQDWSSGR